MICMSESAGVRGMAVFSRLRMPSLGGATGWLNSEPLGFAANKADADEPTLAPGRGAAATCAPRLRS